MLKLTILLALATLGLAQEDGESIQNKEDENLITLNLSNQGITSLNEYDFTKYPLLEELDLSNNDIEYIKEDVLIDNNHLKKLNLSGNKNLKFPEFSTLLISEIEELSLANCNIQHLPANIFDGLLNLKVIDLSENPLDEEGINVSTLLALLSPKKIILPAIHESMIKEICNELDITIGIKSQDYSDAIKCEDVRKGEWQNVRKEEASQEINLEEQDEENQPQPENEEDNIIVEIKREADPEETVHNDDPSQAEGSEAKGEETGEAEEKVEADPTAIGQEENVDPPAAQLEETKEPDQVAPEGADENKLEPDPSAQEGQENKEPDENKVEPNPSTQEAPEENKEPDEAAPEGAEDSKIEPDPSTQEAPEQDENKIEPENNAEASAPEGEATNQDNLEPPVPDSQDNVEAPENKDNLEPPALEGEAENQDNLEPPALEGEAENQDNLEPPPAEGGAETQDNLEPPAAENQDNLEPPAVEAGAENQDNHEAPAPEVNPETTDPNVAAPDTIDGANPPDAVDGKRMLPPNENQEAQPKEGNKPKQKGIGIEENIAPRSAINVNAANPSGEPKTGESKSSGAGSTVLVVLVVVVVVAGAAAFGYKFYKTRKYQAAQSVEPVERELKEIVVDKRLNGSNNPQNQIEAQPLMDRLANSIEIKEIDETIDKQNEIRKSDTTTANSSNNNGPYVPTTTPIKPPHINKDDHKTEI